MASEGEGYQEQGNLWWGVGRTWQPAAKSVPGFLVTGLVEYLMSCDMNDLVHTPGILGLCIVKVKVEKQLEARQPAGRCHRRSIGCGAPEHPALGQQRQCLPPTLRDQGLGL